MNAALSAAAALDDAWAASLVFGVAAVLLALRGLQECAAATAVTVRTLRALKQGDMSWPQQPEIIASLLVAHMCSQAEELRLIDNALEIGHSKVPLQSRSDR